MSRLKPLHIRIRQRLHNLHYWLLAKLGICTGCGWRRTYGEYSCAKCYFDAYGE